MLNFIEISTCVMSMSIMSMSLQPGSSSLRAGTVLAGPGSAGAEPARLIGDGTPGAVVAFDIRDQDGRNIPARLTFVREGTPDEMLFARTDADPERLAVRRNVVYTLHGVGEIVVPTGRYIVHVTRGLEYSRARVEVDLRENARVEVRAALRHEVDTSGWVSGDYHLHTLTYSGHGDSNMPERIISLVGEGVEFAVATDHNHNTDYAPTVDRLDAAGLLAHVTGNEVSTPIGHFNAFPLEADRAILDHRLTDANELFRVIRQERNRFGTTPVVQVNHPRWDGIDYFTQTGLDPLSGDAVGAMYSDAFDTVEVFNENAGWGYFDPETADVATGGQTHSVLRDWYNLLNRGVRVAAVGNSDSHTVHAAFAGYPRNFTRSDARTPTEIDPAHLADELRAMRVFTTSGPFVEFGVARADGGGAAEDATPAGMGETISGSRVAIDLRVQAASWIDCDRVKIVVNGDVVREIPVPQTRSVERLRTRVVLDLSAYDDAPDAWIAVLVEGDESLSPVIHDAGRAILPLAVCNPVYVDVNGDGAWTSPRAWADGLARRGVGDIERAMGRARPTERGLLARATAERLGERGDAILASGLRDPSRETRLRALSGASRIGGEAGDGVGGGAPRTRDALEGLIARGETTDLERVSAVGALARLDAERGQALVLEMLTSGKLGAIRRHDASLLDVLDARAISDWEVVGPFDNPRGSAGLDAALPPELGEGSFAIRGEGAQTWRSLKASEDGYLDFVAWLGANAESAIIYARATIEADAAQEAMLALGSDDGCRVWVNGEIVIRDDGRHAARPFAHLVPIRLRKGSNTILVKVENGNGDAGLYASILGVERGAAHGQGTPADGTQGR